MGLLVYGAPKNGMVIQICQMSMDLTGIKKEKLTDGIDVVGVATMIDILDDSNAIMFI
jgi:peroxiredoxin family protein